jgi:hypothetical protein
MECAGLVGAQTSCAYSGLLLAEPDLLRFFYCVGRANSDTILGHHFSAVLPPVSLLH